MFSGSRTGVISGLVAGAIAGCVTGLMPLTPYVFLDTPAAGIPVSDTVGSSGMTLGARAITMSGVMSDRVAGASIRLGADPVIITVGNAVAITGTRSQAGAVTASASAQGTVPGAGAILGAGAATGAIIGSNDLPPAGVVAGSQAVSTSATAQTGVAGAGIVAGTSGTGDSTTIVVNTIAQIVRDGVGAAGITSSAIAQNTLPAAGVTTGSNSVTGSSYASETVALLGRFGGSYDATQQDAINALIAGLKTDGLWTTIDVLHVVAGSKTQADALLNWKSTSFNLSITGSLTYATGRNFSGFSISNYLSDGFIPSTAGGNFVQNSATIGIYSTGDGQSSNVAIGAISSGATIYNRIFLRNTSNQIQSEMNSTGQLSSSTNTVYSAVGLSTSVRTGASATALYKNSTQLLTGTQASSGNQSVQLFTGAQNNNGTPGVADANLALVAQVKASGWNATQVSNFNSRLNTYLQSLKSSTYTFSYSSDGDSNGVFWALGSNMRSQAWVNPAYTGANPGSESGWNNNAAVYLSASGYSSGTVGLITDRTTGTFTTTNSAGSWVRVDLGGFRGLSCNRYSIRHAATTSNYLRNWNLQGSNDGSSWTNVDIRTGDTTINASSAWGTFTPNQGVTTSFRFWRILSTGLDSSSQNVVALGEWEMYGTLTISNPTTFTYSAPGDQNGILYYLACNTAAESWTNGWVNPHATGLVTVSASSVGGGNVSQVVSRVQSGFFTNNSAGSWLQFDFGASRTVRVDAYQIRNYSFASNMLRNWNIQGSNDGSSWTNLDIRTSDATLNNAHVWGYWTVNQGNTSFWRYIRILSTGLDSNSANYLSVGQFELYGAIA